MIFRGPMVTKVCAGSSSSTGGWRSVRLMRAFHDDLKRPLIRRQSSGLSAADGRHLCRRERHCQFRRGGRQWVCHKFCSMKEIRDIELAKGRSYAITFLIRFGTKCVFYRLYHAFRIRRSCGMEVIDQLLVASYQVFMKVPFGARAKAENFVCSLVKQMGFFVAHTIFGSHRKRYTEI